MPDLGGSLYGLIVVLLIWAGTIALALWLIGRLFPVIRTNHSKERQITKTKVTKE